MSRLKELRQAKADNVANLREIVEAADPAKGLSDEHKQKADEIKATISRINSSIEIAEALADEERVMEAVVDPNKAAEQAAKENEEDGSKFASFGEQMAAVAKYQIDGVKDPRLNFQAAPSGMSEGVGQDGGFLVQTDFSSDLWRRAYNFGEISRRVRRIPISQAANSLKMNAVKESSRANGQRWGGVNATWEGEETNPSGSRPKFRVIELKLKKLTGLAYVTDDLLRDSVALGAILQQAFEEEFGFKLDDAVMRGTGAGMPLGYLDHASAVTVDETIDPSTGSLQAADTVIVDNVSAMWARMWARSRKNAIWLINQEVEPQLMTMKIGDTPIYLPQGGASAAPYARLLGRPIVPVEQASALGDKGDVQLVDPSQYIMIDKGGIQSNSSMHVRFIQDEMTFRFILRADGQPAWDTALTPHKGSNTLSPFVILGERDGTA